MLRISYVSMERIFLCRRIAKIRKNAMLSQKDLASLVGISVAYLRRIENGKVNISLELYLHIIYLMCYRIDIVEDLPF